MEALLFDAVRTAIRAFGKELRQYGVLVPYVWEDGLHDGAAIIAIDTETALAHVRAGGDIDGLAQTMWVLHGSELVTPRQKAYFRHPEGLTAIEVPGFVVGAVAIRVLRVVPVAHAAAGGMPQ